MVKKIFWTTNYPSDNQTVSEIEYGAAHGVTIGDTVLFSDNKLAISDTGVVEVLRRHSALLKCTGSSQNAQYSYAAVQLPIPKSLENNLLTRLAQSGIILRNYENLYWNSISVIQSKTEMDSVLTLMTMAEHLKKLANKIEGTPVDSTIHSGIFRGRTISQALKLSSAEHVYCFLTFILSHAHLYHKNNYYFQDIYTTWMIQKTPCSLDGLIYLFSNFTQWAELDRIIGLYAGIIEEPLLWQWYRNNNGKLLTNPALSMKHSLIINAIAYKLNFNRLKAFTHYQIGHLYFQNDDYQNAATNYQQTLGYFKLKKELNEDFINTVQNLALAECYAKNSWQAEKLINNYLSISITQFEQYDQPIFLNYIPELLLIKSEISIYQNKYYQAIHILKDAIRFVANTENKSSAPLLAQIYHKLAKTYKYMGNMKLYEKYFALYNDIQYSEIISK